MTNPPYETVSTMPVSRLRSRSWVVAISGVVAGAGILFVAYRAYEDHRLRALEATCERIARWAQEQPLESGAHPRIELPPSFGLPAGSEVNLVKTAGGEVVVLVKTSIGWKMNYEGVLYSTRPLDLNDFGTDSYDHDVIDIPDIEAESPVIRERVNARFFRVYFDLG